MSSRESLTAVGSVRLMSCEIRKLVARVTVCQSELSLNQCHRGLINYS